MVTVAATPEAVAPHLAAAGIKARPLAVSVTFNLDRVRARLGFGPDLAARLRPAAAGAARFNLVCNVIDDGHALTVVELDHNAALFGDGRAALLADEYLLLARPAA
ncbi:hypothetical protein EFP18_18795 [Burkholderia glumae]|uniref:hypothetical protein n=1 Tax=Burkholderia glumae TaxID=337 RepID=UPI001373C180|nr:hypothetical protein [Burkholderia glumae]MCQ0033346.1 hypothetical protein [Burkholderia glumae]MCQ0038016.1 hypothetical protein [Burkholderia glumae]MCR1767426.1 hypothetical protein [Burkholderia glumae]QHP91289.1 hypothetical protein EXE55_10295 [Burkholderia glumae]QJW79072.1 hypothetical protein GAS18_10120 [Burkholderia glumae]